MTATSLAATSVEADASPSGDSFEALLSRFLAPPLGLVPAQARLVLLLAGGFAVWTDVLFRGAELGLNITLWFASLVALVIVAGRRVGRPLPADRIAVLMLAVEVSAVWAWRDSGALLAFGVLGAWGLLGLGVGLPRGVRALAVSPVACVMALVSDGAALLTSEWRLIAQVSRGTAVGRASLVPAAPIVRAVLLAAPILFVFGALFVAADAVFAEQLGSLVRFDLSGIKAHAGWLLFGAWIGSAAIATAVGVELPEEIVASMPERHRLARTEVAIVLGSLATLFALFVVVQIRYLFGGEDAVRSSVDLTYAEYARRGFFELVIASLLLLPVLAAINWAREHRAASTQLFLSLAAVLIVLLFVIMTSAWQRLSMYREAFGLTELRFYAAVTLPWLGIALIWFVASVVRDRIEQFLAGAVLLAVAMLFALYVVSPQDLIVRANAARIEQGKSFDAEYAASLNADAVPALVAYFATVPAEGRCEVAAALSHYAELDDGWRSWNLSRFQASRLLAQHPEALVCR